MRPVPRWFTAICWVMAILFSLSVGLQVNDPDPIRWMVLYAAAGIAIAMLPYWRPAAIASLAIGIVSAVWGGYLEHEVFRVLKFSDLFMKMNEKGGAVEVGREAGGLIIVAVAMIGGAAFRWTRS
ncbi:MAG: hypothetical protein HOV81_13650 [Kofleriaceae bacterium]|nr:hypothetical protein [Kofleriaceae bacterium]